MQITVTVQMPKTDDEGNPLTNIHLRDIRADLDYLKDIITDEARGLFDGLDNDSTCKVVLKIEE